MAALVTVAALVVLPVRVAAHIAPDPPEAQAGSVQSVGFTVEHGCDGSATVRLDMRLPEGVSAVTPQPPEGWSGSLDQNVVTFVGGPLPDDTPATFRVEMTLPATPDVTLYFPFVQRCEVGELRWIDTPDDGTGAELDQPAPAMVLTGPAASPPPTTTPSTVEPPATTATTTTTVAVTTVPAPASTVAPVDSATTVPAAGSTVPSNGPGDPTATSTPPTPIDGDDDGDGFGAGTAVFVGAVAAVLAVAGIVAVQVRRRR